MSLLIREEGTSLVAHMVKSLPAMQETWVWSLGLGNPLEKGMATHCSILAWRIPWREESGGLQPMGLQRIRHDWATNTSTINIPLSGGTTVYLSIHLMKDVLVAFKFWQSWISCYKHLCAGFCMDISFQLFWININSKIAWLSDKNMSSFVMPAVFQSSCTILHSHQQCTRFSVAPHPGQHLVLSVFWGLAILVNA